MVAAASTGQLAWVTGILVTLAAASCSDRPAALTPVSRDSVGVRITEVPARAAPDSGLWVLGQAEAWDASVLGAATEAAFLGDGGVAVLDGRNRRVSVSHRGDTLSTYFGAEGFGPGEFRDPVGLKAYRGDSLAVLDAGLRRVLVFSGSGVYGRAIAVRIAAQRVEFVGTLNDGSFVLGASTFAPGNARFWRQPWAIVRIDSAGLRVDTLSVLSGEEFYEIEFGGGPVFGLRPYGKKSIAAAGGKHVVLNAGDDCDLVFQALDGLERALLRARCRGRAVTTEAREAWTAARVERVERAPNARFATALYRSPRIPHPRSTPPLDQLLVDDCGVLWAGHYSLPGDTVKEWSLYSTGGVRLTTLTTPSSAELQQVSENLILAIHSDAFGVERVVAYPLSRPRCAISAP